MNKCLSCLSFVFYTSLSSAFVNAETEVLLSLEASGVQLTSDAAGQYVYVPDQENNALVVVNSSTLEVEQNISLPGIPEDVALDEYAGLAYITSRNIPEILVMELGSYEFLDSIEIPQAAYEVVVAEDFIYASTYSSGSGIMRVDKNNQTYTGSFSEGVFTYARGALELTPEGDKLVFANRGLSPGTLAVFDISGEAPVLLIKNNHGDLGGNGQNISLDPLNGSFLSYAVGGGNGMGYSIALLDINDFSWMGELVTGAYPRAIHHSIDGYSSYTNNTASIVDVWDNASMQRIDSFAVKGNPKDFVDLQNGALLGVIGDTEFAIYRVKAFTPEPPAPKVEGSMTGTALSKLICYNKETRQRIVAYISGSDFDCVEEGLQVSLGDRVRVTLHGNVD